MVMELFRRLLLQRLHQAERLSERFRDRLLSWAHPGFSVFAGPPVEASAVELLESQARYISRPALAMDALQKRQDGTLAMQTPPDPRTGAILLALDPLEWIQRITAHIPDPGLHSQRYYGAYSNRARAHRHTEQDSTDSTAEARPADQESDFTSEPRRTWARLLRKVFEVDPLLRPRCGGTLKIVSVITDPRVVEGILRYLESEASRVRNPFEPRAPPPRLWQPLNVIPNRDSSYQARQTGSARLARSRCVPAEPVMPDAPTRERGFFITGALRFPSNFG